MAKRPVSSARSRCDAFGAAPSNSFTMSKRGSPSTARCIMGRRSTPFCRLYGFRSSPGSLAIFAAIRCVSLRVSILAVRSAARFFFIIDVGELLAAMIADDETSADVLDRPEWREAKFRRLGRDFAMLLARFAFCKHVTLGQSAFWPPIGNSSGALRATGAG
jgi:hypothetical protein